MKYKSLDEIYNVLKLESETLKKSEKELIDKNELKEEELKKLKDDYNELENVYLFIFLLFVICYIEQKCKSKEEEINELNTKLSCLNETTNKLISSYMELKKNVFLLFTILLYNICIVNSCRNNEQSISI